MEADGGAAASTGRAQSDSTLSALARAAVDRQQQPSVSELAALRHSAAVPAHRTSVAVIETDFDAASDTHSTRVVPRQLDLSDRSARLQHDTATSSSTSSASASATSMPAAVPVSSCSPADLQRGAAASGGHSSLNTLRESVSAKSALASRPVAASAPAGMARSSSDVPTSARSPGSGRRRWSQAPSPTPSAAADGGRGERGHLLWRRATAPHELDAPQPANSATVDSPGLGVLGRSVSFREIRRAMDLRAAANMADFGRANLHRLFRLFDQDKDNMLNHQGVCEGGGDVTMRWRR